MVQKQNYGIDAIQFYTSPYYLNLEALAEARGLPPDRYRQTLGQLKMAVTAPDEDVVTMAAEAAYRLLEKQGFESIEQIDCLLFATESGIDQSKSAGIFVHKLLGLSSHCRVVELKQACYGGTMGLRLGLDHLKARASSGSAEKKVLLIASDLAKYGLKSNAESSQGAGAVALLLSANPRILAIEPEYGVHTEDLMDFWRPNYRQEAFVDGRLSCEMYLKLAQKTWQAYAASSGRGYHDHAKFCYHVSVPKLVERAHAGIRRINDLPAWSGDALQDDLFDALYYGREIGNCYTAALYLSLCSVLERCSANLENQRLGLYSYGSGCIAEFFSGIVQPGYRQALNTQGHQDFLNHRTSLSVSEYEAFYDFRYPQDGSQLELPHFSRGRHRLARFVDHKRIYEVV